MNKIIDKTIINLSPAFQSDTEISRVILFGSHARNHNKIWSDIDLAIVCENPQKVNRAALQFAADNFDIDIDLVYTTEERIQSSEKFSDVNFWIKKEGVEIWQR
jgi:predicted nucleotidyltransferase